MLPEDDVPTQPNGIPTPPNEAPPPSISGPKPMQGPQKEKAPIWELPPEPVKMPQMSQGGGNRLGLAISLVVLGAMAIILIIVLSMNHSPSDLAANKTPVPSATATSNPKTPTPTQLPAVSLSDATNLVNQFYLLVGAQQYQNAYKLLSSKQQSQQSLSAFTQSWNGTLQVIIKQDTVSAVPATDGLSIMFAFQYSEIVQQGDGSVQNKLMQANVTIGYDISQLRITAISSTDITPTATPTVAPSPTSLPTVTPVATMTVTPATTVTVTPTTKP